MKKFATHNLQQSLSAFLTRSQEPDGLAVVPPDGESDANFTVAMPARLLDWLTHLRLLRHVPLAYLVPDPALLPSESIRFFHIDRTWTDRLIDGVMSAGNIGTLDMTFTAATLTDLRRMLDEQLGITPTTPLSGMLIRSELVSRWPDLLVDPRPSAKCKVLRKECLSRSILIAIIAGVPTEVRLREPDVGLRFGVEVDAAGTGYEVNFHNVAGVQTKTNQSKDTIPVEVFAGRVLHVAKLPATITSAGNTGVAGDPTRSRDVALNLRQLPYIARFLDHVAIDKGSVTPTAATKVKVRDREVPIARMLGTRGRALLQGDK